MYIMVLNKHIKVATLSLDLHIVALN